MFRTFKFLGTSLDVLLDNLLDVLKVVEQDLFGLLRSRLFVGVVDFDKVVLLLLKKDFSVLNGIEKIEVFAVFVRFEVKVVKKLHKTFVELSNFDVTGARFNLALDYCNLTVLFSKQFLLRDQLLIFLFKLLVNLVKSGALFIFFDFHSPSLNLL